MAPTAGVDGSSPHQFAWFIVANPAAFCHKRDLHRPADQGLPWR